MPAVRQSEISVGLVIHLDPNILSQLGGSAATTKKGHAVTDFHYFLVLSINKAAGECTAMPLFSEPGIDRELLKEDLKRGRQENWIGEDSYLFRWQAWRIPFASIEAASTTDESDPTTRRTYAIDQPKELSRLLRLLDHNNQPFVIT